MIMSNRSSATQSHSFFVAFCIGACLFAACGSLRSGPLPNGQGDGDAGQLRDGSSDGVGPQDADVDLRGDASRGDMATASGGTPGGSGGSGTGGAAGNQGSGSGGQMAGSGGATGGSMGSGGAAGRAATGGVPGSGGAATGGVVGSGGAATGGVLGSGGAATGGSGGRAMGGAGGSVSCTKRDCTSDKDNDCNGQADNTESTYCKCSTAASPQPCSTGLNGICSSGTQVCNVSGDKSSTAWGPCTQLKVKGTEACANLGADDDCDGILDNVPVTSCAFGTGLGACANGGITACNGTTKVCNATVSTLGDATVLHTGPAANGSWDWDCDGVVTKEYPDAAPPPPACTGLDMTACSSQPMLKYALNPFACGDLGDIGQLYCAWLAVIPGCTNKSGQSTGFQQRCR